MITEQMPDTEIEFGDHEEDKEENVEERVTIDEIPREQRNLRTQAYDKSISDVVAMINTGDIVLDPDYQRNYVWDNKKASLLVESILLNVPIPVVYVAEDEDSRWNVVDGLQRLNSLRRFFANEFRLRGLEVLQELNGSQYSTLNPKASRILRNGIIRIILIFKESHPDIKYEIFMRLNRGAVKLNEQELRNCLYRGSLNDLVKKLRENQRFLSMIGLREPHKRMDDAELILRYFTLSASYDHATGELHNYTGKVKSALNKYLAKHRNATEFEIARLENRFVDTINKAYAVFGTRAFQRIYPDGSFEGRPNRAIMDVIMLTFEHEVVQALQENRDQIINSLQTLPAQDKKFDDAITFATSDKKQLEYRLTAWKTELSRVIDK